MTKVFIDGRAGTTGLRIQERMEARPDIELITLPEELRKDALSRKEAMLESDITFLCLPDQAAVEAMELVTEKTKIIDTSTAHRVDPLWTYGFPELKDQRPKIQNATRIANPGCHASGFIALVAPLVASGLLAPDVSLSAFSVTGYSGGGKKMIESYEDENRDPSLDAPRQYALTQNHKHLPEMVRYAKISQTPVFCPIVSDFYAGMTVTVPVFASWIRGSVQDVKDVYKNYYEGPLIRYEDHLDPMLPSNDFDGSDDMVLSVLGNEERILLTARYDNLGKGASGAAIQNMNILLGLPETTGLVLRRNIT